MPKGLSKRYRLWLLRAEMALVTFLFGHRVEVYRAHLRKQARVAGGDLSINAELIVPRAMHREAVASATRGRS